MLHLFVAHSCLRGHGLYKPDPTLCRNVCIVLTIIIIALSLKKKSKNAYAISEQQNRTGLSSESLVFLISSNFNQT